MALLKADSGNALICRSPGGASFRGVCGAAVTTHQSLWPPVILETPDGLGLGLAPVSGRTVRAVHHPGGYVGESTRREIAYAESLGKPVRYLSREGSARTGDDRPV